MIDNSDSDLLDAEIPELDSDVGPDDFYDAPEPNAFVSTVNFNLVPTPVSYAVRSASQLRLLRSTSALPSRAEIRFKVIEVGKSHFRFQIFLGGTFVKEWVGLEAGQVVKYTTSSRDRLEMMMFDLGGNSSAAPRTVSRRGEPAGIVNRVKFDHGWTIDVKVLKRVDVF